METLEQQVYRLERESCALRACALKYLGWMGHPHPAMALDGDVRDPEMIGKALARELKALERPAQDSQSGESVNRKST